MRAPSFCRSRMGAATILTFALAGCFTYRKVEVKQVNPRASTFVVSPVRAHLADGSTIVFAKGFTVTGANVNGAGLRYAAGSSSAMPSNAIALDSVIGMEVFETDTLVGKSFLVTTAVTAVTFVGTVALFKAIFGSCPTFYSDSSGTPVLEAEGFSYSIAPMFEQRDVHRLRAVPSEDGVLSLQVRNEALETHYINQLELLEVRHASDEYVTPDNKQLPLALRGLRPPTTAIDRAGRDITQEIDLADGKLFVTDSATFANARAGDLEDHIDLEIANPARTDTVALVLKMRNSLLNTVLLYDQILGAPGAQSLDWLGHDIKRIAPAIEMGKWYSAHMGMRVSVRDGETYKIVGRIGDSGPIAFHEVAFLVPVPGGAEKASVHVRLSFVADQWRIDQVRSASTYRRPSVRRVSASEVVMSDASQNEAARQGMRNADGQYVVTSPAQTFTIRFAVGNNDGASRTFLLASQGYYTEWVRGSWIKSASGQPFRTTDGSIVAALDHWRKERPTLEREFYSTRIATR